MTIIKKCYIQLIILFAGSVVSLHFGTRSGESAMLGAFVLIPTALVTIWKTLAALKKEWRSAKNWLFAAIVLGAAGYLGFFGLVDIFAYPYRFY